MRALLPYPWPAFFRETKFINTPDNKNRESKRKNKLYIIYFVILPATISNYSFKEPGSPPRDSSHEDSSREYRAIIARLSKFRLIDSRGKTGFRNGPFPVNSSWIRKQFQIVPKDVYHARRLILVTLRSHVSPQNFEKKK